MTIGEKLIALRSLKGNTQVEFCQSFNKRFPSTKMTRSYYSMVELDQKGISIEKLKSLVMYYNTTADDLLFDHMVPAQLTSKTSKKNVTKRGIATPVLK